MTELSEALKSTAAAVTRQLDELLPQTGGPRGRVVEAMRYACLGGGKRLRPFLTVASARLFDVRDPRALRVAAAVEMVHCYSLVHDDLPAMDDSDLRRGQPTVHRKFDEATAVLAGDGLLTEAFAILSEPATHKNAEIRGELTRGLAEAAGARGMVGGQQVDMSNERNELDLDGITDLQRMKTGALIEFACEAGAILGGAEPESRAALRGYARDLGLAFQIADDLLDVEASTQEAGKPTGQDAAAGKATFVGLMGQKRARIRAEELVDSACGHLDRFGEKADLLRHTAQFVVNRRS